MTAHLPDGPGGPSPNGKSPHTPTPAEAMDHAHAWWETFEDVVRQWMPLACRRLKAEADRDDARQQYWSLAWQRTLSLARRGPIRYDQWGAAMYRAALTTLCLREFPGGLCGRRLHGTPRTSARSQSPCRGSAELAARGHDPELKCPGVCSLAQWDQARPSWSALDPAQRVQVALDWADLCCRLKPPQRAAVQALAEGRNRLEAAAVAGLTVRAVAQLRRRLREHWRALQYGE